MLFKKAPVLLDLIKRWAKIGQNWIETRLLSPVTLFCQNPFPQIYKNIVAADTMVLTRQVFSFAENYLFKG